MPAGDADLCPGVDDSIDIGRDGIPDGCDICAGSDDRLDAYAYAYADADGATRESLRGRRALSSAIWT